MNRIPVRSFNQSKANVNVENPRCFKIFKMSCKSKATFLNYQYHLNTFLKWADKDYESLLILSDIELKETLEDYAMFCQTRYATSSFRGIFSAIEKFLFVNDKNMNRKKLMMVLPEKKYAEQRAITTEEIRLLLFTSSNPRSKAIIHILTATGCRPEALADLKLKDIELMADGFTSILFYQGTNNQSQ